MFQDTTRNRTIVITAIIAVTLLLGLGAYNIYLSIQRAGKIAVELIVVPGDAKVNMNGQTVNINGLYVTPGDYVFSASKEGFKTMEAHVHIAEGSPNIVTLPLQPESSEAKKWAEQNQSHYDALEGAAGKAANEQGEAVSEKNPVIRVLPYKNFLYTIGYKNDTSDPTGKSIIVTIDATPGYRNAAIRKLRELGYDPTQLKIEFTKYESPFSNE